jgi:hypothetical protein
MAIANDIRKSMPDTPLMALIGATDLAVERVRLALAEAEKAVGGVEPRTLPATAQSFPLLAMTKAAELLGLAEAQYAELAERGRQVVEHVRSQQTTQDLLAQGRITVSMTKAAVTTARRAAAETASAARGTISTVRRDAGSAAGDTGESIRRTVRDTRTSAQKSTQTARSGAAATRSRAKAATTSARKTAAAAGDAAEDAAKTLGD